MGPFASIALSILAILACGSLGAFAGYAVVTALAWTGTAGSLVAAFVGMVVAVAAWATGVAALRKLGWLR